MANQNNNSPYKRPRMMEQPINYNYQALMVPINYGQDAGDNYFNSFPPGYRFCPTDEELLFYYLTPKVKNQPLPRNRIPEVKFYEYNPETLTANYEKCGENSWYFFTPRNKKYPKGKRPKRDAGNGYWKATGADKDIEMIINGRKYVLGHKKTLVYYLKRARNGVKTNWIMHEFRVPDEVQQAIPRKPNADPMLLDEWVLCKIYKKPSNENGSSGTNNGNEESETTVAIADPTAISQPEPPVSIADPPAISLPEVPVVAIADPPANSELETLYNTLLPLPSPVVDYSINSNYDGVMEIGSFPNLDYCTDGWMQPDLPDMPSGFETPSTLGFQSFPDDHQNQQWDSFNFVGDYTLPKRFQY